MSIARLRALTPADAVRFIIVFVKGGRNEYRPIKGIDTIRLVYDLSDLLESVEMSIARLRALTHNHLGNVLIFIKSRNEYRPIKGIDTFNAILFITIGVL